MTRPLGSTSGCEKRTDLVPGRSRHLFLAENDPTSDL
jgi:hypothetical protein